jgi:hypothetical protein
MTTRLQAAIRAKYGTPERATKALGLPVSLLRANDAARRPRAHARDQEEEALKEGLASEASTFSERMALVLQHLRGRLSQEDLLRVEGILRGEENATDEAEAEREREAAPAMDSLRMASSRARKLTSRIGVA